MASITTTSNWRLCDIRAKPPSVVQMTSCIYLISRSHSPLLRWSTNLSQRSFVPQTLRLPLRIVFYLEDGDWIAHCLEFDLIGDGPTQQDAMKELAEAIFLQIEASVEHDNPANLFSPADGKFFEMFAAGNDITRAELELRAFQPPRFDKFQIERCEFREYVGTPSCTV